MHGGDDKCLQILVRIAEGNMPRERPLAQMDNVNVYIN
jgi:hypothetical protein